MWSARAVVCEQHVESAKEPYLRITKMATVATRANPIPSSIICCCCGASVGTLGAASDAGGGVGWTVACTFAGVVKAC